MPTPKSAHSSAWPRLAKTPAWKSLWTLRAPATLCVFGRGDNAGHEALFGLDAQTGTSREFLKITDLQYPDWGLAPDGSLLAIFSPEPHFGRIRLVSMHDLSARDLFA